MCHHLAELEKMETTRDDMLQDLEVGQRLSIVGFFALTVTLVGILCGTQAILDQQLETSNVRIDVSEFIYSISMICLYSCVVCSIGQNC